VQKKASYLRFFWSKYSFILSFLIFSKSSLLRLAERFLLVFTSNSSLVSWSNSGKPEKSEDSFADLNLIRSKMKQAIKRMIAVVANQKYVEEIMAFTLQRVRYC